MSEAEDAGAAATARVPHAIGDRIAGGVLAVLAIAAWFQAGTFVTNFRQAIGPNVFPQLISIPLAVLSIYLLLRPGYNERWPQLAALMRQLALVIVLIGYAYILEPAGFVPATIVSTALLTRLFGAHWKQALISSVILAVMLYLLFEFALGIPLPNIPGLNY